LMQTMPMGPLPMQMPMQAMPMQMPAMPMPTPTQAMPVPQGQAMPDPAATDPADDDPPALVDDPPTAVFTGLPTLDELSEEELRTIVIDVISDKTGYPAEMIGLDMDLEADLSIDSIKRLEIIGALGDRIQLPDTSGASDEEASSALEKMTSIKTLRGLVSWLKETDEEPLALTDAQWSALEEAPSPQSAMPSQPAAPVEPVPAAPDVPTLDEPVAITRLIWEEKDHPYSTEGCRDLTGQRLAVTDDGGGFAQSVCDALEKIGAQAILVDPETTDELNDLNGLVMINASASPIRFNAEDLFILLKKMDPQAMKWLLVFDDTMGALIESTDPDYDEIKGFSGLVKTIQHEYPSIVCTSITGETPFDQENFAQSVISELVEPTRFPDIFYRGTSRIEHAPAAVELDRSDPRELLDPDDIVLVLGGAQGISPTLVEALAKDEPCCYILVGRTLRDTDLAGSYPALGGVDQIQRYLAGHEHFDTPKDLTKKAREVAKAQSIEAALARIEAAGATAQYMSADVSDADQFRALIADVRESYGHIDAVIHAAGILEDKLIRDKTLGSFQRVYSTKVNPLRVICEDLLDNLKRLVMFSSTTAAFGNAGQCDYAAGNSTFDTLASVLAARGARIQAVSTAWGGWKGAGMVSASLETEMKKRGLTLIPLAQGSEFFRDELRYGHDATVMAMGGEPDMVTSFLQQNLISTLN